MTGKKTISLTLVAPVSILVSAYAANAVTFVAPELLGRPTDTSITVHAVADAGVDVYYEYGTSPGVYATQTAVAGYAAGVPIVVTLENLLPDTRYYFRMRYRETGETSFAARPEYTFHTQRPSRSTFTFTIQTDSHIYDRKGDHALYTIAEQNQRADAPDFMLDLGDTFGDDHNPDGATYAQEDQLHLDQRPFMSIVGGSAPVFLALGNHEGEAGYYLSITPPDNLAIYATLARQKYFPNPVPNGFYSGNGVFEGHGVGLPQNYYAWQWGDALFVVLDGYRYNAVDPKVSGDLWDWTLGEAQYNWFRTTLQTSHARYKFVFAHHVLGQTRGGVTQAGKYEWGGNNKNGTYGFDVKRPGWGTPIHQLMVQNGVNIFFQGHDHLFAREELDGVVYQETPMPSDATYHVGDPNADAYTGVVLNNSGHLRVTVSAAQVTVDYVRAYLPGDGANGELAHSYTIASLAPLAGFSTAPAAPQAGQTVTFTDQSENAPISWDWDFGDGATSTAQNPTHAYASAGSYAASLTVANAHGSDSVTHGVTVASPPPPPVADGQHAGLAATFSRNATISGQIDVTYDASACAAQRAVILYGNLGNFSTYQGCAQGDAGSSGTAVIDASALDDVWFDIVWTNGSTAGHPGYGSSGTVDVERSWNAAGRCGVTADDHGRDSCP